MNNETKTARPAASGAAEADEASDTYTPRRMTFAENVILTIKVFAGAAFVIAAIWGLTLWTSGK